MADLIPDKARHVGWDALIAARQEGAELSQAYARALEAAAPHILAAELDRWAEHCETEATKYAQRAPEVLPEPLATAVAVVLLDHVGSDPDPNVHELAHAILTAPVSAPDRDTLVDVLLHADSSYDMVAMHEDTPGGYGLAEHLADALISAGLVRTPVTAEQIETCARELHRRDLGDVDAWWHEPEDRRDMWRSKARTAAKALGLTVEEETRG